MNFLRKFMYGRYGSDQLGVALILFSLLMMILLRVISTLTGIWWIVLLDWLPVLWAVFRMLSRSIQKRRLENEKFLALWNPVKARFSMRKQQFKQRKTYKFFKCPQCGARLRVPRQGGKKLSVKCRKCGFQFIKKA